MKVYALDEPSLKIDAAGLEKGKALSIMCMACHGPGFQSAGSPGPDLRESKLALSEDNVWNVLHDGTLMQRGMPRFDNLSRAQVHALYLLIRASARESLGIKVLEEAPKAAVAVASKSAYTTAKTKIGVILDNPKLCEIVDKHVPGLSKRGQIGLARSMTLKQLQNYSEEFSDPVLAKIDAEFSQLPAPEKKN